MSDIKRWENLPTEIMVIIVHKLSFMDDFFKISAVCRSWKSIISDLKEYEKPPLPLKRPLLLLGKQISEDYGESDEETSEKDEDTGEEDNGSDQDLIKEDNDPDMIREDDDSDQYMIKDEESNQDMSEEDDGRGNSILSVDNSCSFLSILSGTTYNIELPEARGRAVLGTNKGWLITLGRDFQINLLHPFVRHQIPLPSMLTFPSDDRYTIGFPTGSACDVFLGKVVLSSTIPVNSKVCHLGTESTPIIMTIYGIDSCLAFIRLGDKVWTVIKDPTPHLIFDIVYHKGKFYAVGLESHVYVCDIKECRATKISVITNSRAWSQMYLVESSSGSDLFAVASYKYHDYAGMVEFRTSHFRVWKLELKYSDLSDIPLHTWTESNNLGNESIFVGLNSSVSLPSSDEIEPNCIYFTDDEVRRYCYYKCRGDSYDTGIFDLQTRKIKTFQVKPPRSFYGVSPPLWYI